MGITAPLQVLLAHCCTLKSDLLVRRWNTSLSASWFISVVCFFFLTWILLFDFWNVPIPSSLRFPSCPINSRASTVPKYPLLALPAGPSVIRCKMCFFPLFRAYGLGNSIKQESSFYQRSAARKEANHQFEACTSLAGTLLHIQIFLCSKADAGGIFSCEQNFSGVAPWIWCWRLSSICTCCFQWSSRLEKHSPVQLGSRTAVTQEPVSLRSARLLANPSQRWKNSHWCHRESGLCLWQALSPKITHFVPALRKAGQEDKVEGNS